MARVAVLLSAVLGLCGPIKAVDYQFEILNLLGSHINIATPDSTPAGYGMDYSLRTNPNDAVVQIYCSSLNFGQGNGCEEAGLTVTDGENEQKICQTQQEFSYESQASTKVKVSLRAGPGAKVRCTARAVHNPFDKFLIYQSEEVNSQEHGVAPGVKRTSCPCGASNKARIVGGSETKENEYPFIAGMVNVDTMFLFCGATLVSRKHAITAAHCTYMRHDKHKLGLVMGFHDIVSASVYKSKHGEVGRLSKVIEHENYDNVTLKNDIALLVLRNQVEFSLKIQPACMPNARIPLVDQQIKVLGWGKTVEKGPMSDVLLQANLKVVPIDVCAYKYTHVSATSPTQICTYGHGKDSCQGDSGGPLVWLDPETNRYTLVALVSFGRGCASENTPGVNTELAFYLDWLHKHMSATSPSDKTCSKIE